jgi:hypothetical protein
LFAILRFSRIQSQFRVSETSLAFIRRPTFLSPRPSAYLPPSLFVSPLARPLCAAKLVPREGVTPATHPVALDNLNLHLVDGGYRDNSGDTALVQWLNSGLSRLKNSSNRLPKKILIIEINAFTSVKEKYVKEERGTLFQFWAPFLTMFTIRGAAHESSAISELALLRAAWPISVYIGWISDFS